jgi:hypothetical protein
MAGVEEIDGGAVESEERESDDTCNECAVVAAVETVVVGVGGSE